MTKILVYLLLIGLEAFKNKLSKFDKYLSYFNIQPMFKKYVDILNKYLLKHKIFNSFFGLVTLFFITLFGLGVVELILYLLIGGVGVGIFTLVLLVAILMSYTPDASESSYVQAHEKIFGNIFWFIILGWFGSLMYWFVIAIQREVKAISGEYADFISACEKAHAVLAWLPARAAGLVFALIGNFSKVSKVLLLNLKDLNKPASEVLNECGAAATEGKPMPGQKKDSGETIGGLADDELLQRSIITWGIIGILLVFIF